MKTRSESHRHHYAQSMDGSCSPDMWRHGEHETVEVRDVRRKDWLGSRVAWGQKKSRPGVTWMASELSVSTPTSGRLQPRTRGNGAKRRRNQGWNVS